MIDRRHFLKLLSVIPILPKIAIGAVPPSREGQLWVSIRQHAQQAADRGEEFESVSWYPFLDCKPHAVFVSMYVRGQKIPYTWNVIFEQHVPIRGFTGKWICRNGHVRVLMSDAPHRRFRCPVCEGYDGEYRG